VSSSKTGRQKSPQQSPKAEAAPKKAAKSAWKGSGSFKAHEVNEAIAAMPVEERYRRVAPVLGQMAVNVAHRVREHLGDPGTAIIHKACSELSQQVGKDLSPESIDLTTASAKELMIYLVGTDDMSVADAEVASAAYFGMASLLMKLSCDVLAELGDEKGQHVMEQAWEEVAKKKMYWDLVGDQFDFKQMDASSAIALLAGTDALMGVQFEMGKMTPTYAERNITMCTPVAMAWQMGYSHETVRKFCEVVATSVCIRGPQANLPGVKVKYLSRMSYGDNTCREVFYLDEKDIQPLPKKKA